MLPGGIAKLPTTTTTLRAQRRAIHRENRQKHLLAFDLRSELCVVVVNQISLWQLEF